MSIKRHQTEIFEYIKRRHGGKNHKVGIILGLVDNDTIRIGWSKCNQKSGDKFDTLIGLEYAKNRAMKSDNVLTPNCIKRHLRQFSGRCVRYFKDANKLEIPV